MTKAQQAASIWLALSLFLPPPQAGWPGEQSKEGKRDRGTHVTSPVAGFPGPAGPSKGGEKL